MPTVPSPEGLSFALLLTAAGVPIAAALISSFVELLKRGVPALAEANGALMAFVTSAVFFVLAGIAVGVDSLDKALVVFAAWLGTGLAAVGFHSAIIKPAAG